MAETEAPPVRNALSCRPHSNRRSITVSCRVQFMSGNDGASSRTTGESKLHREGKWKVPANCCSLQRLRTGAKTSLGLWRTYLVSPLQNQISTLGKAKLEQICASGLRIQERLPRLLLQSLGASLGMLPPRLRHELYQAWKSTAQAFARCRRRPHWKGGHIIA